MLTYQVYTQVGRGFNDVAFDEDDEPALVDINCSGPRRGRCLQAGREAIKVYADRIGNVFAVRRIDPDWPELGGFAILRRTSGVEEVVV